jgi:anaerobic magnesium-protoporphyrin IX monomethyl ester cyclase
MNISFVSSGSEQLAITLLANMAKQRGHTVNLAFSAALFKDLGLPLFVRLFDDTNLVLDKLTQQQPDIVAFSSLTQSYQWMLGIAREIKKINPAVKTVFGGVHVSAVQEIALKNKEVDYIVVGEGEDAFFEIINAIEEKDFYRTIPNTRYFNPDGILVKGIQTGFKQELEELPYFTKEFWEKDTIVTDNLLTMASRGCPYRCTFCFNNFFAELPDNPKSKNKYVRSRSVDHMINELLEDKKLFKNIKYIDFQDDIFTVNKVWLKEFLTRYKKEINIPFKCLTHPKYMDDEIAQWLKEAGCVWVQIGIQTMDDEYKNSSLKRYEKSAHIEKSLAAMLKAGLNIQADHMLALPGEPLIAQENARKIYAENCPTRILTFWTSFLPGTELLKDGVRDGIISVEQEERLNNGFDFFYFNDPNNIKDKELIKYYQSFQFLFKLFPLLPKFVRRKFKHTHVQAIPASMKRILGMVADVINAIVNQNPELLAYMKYTAYHSGRILFEKMKMKINGRAKFVELNKSEVEVVKKAEAVYSNI